MASRSTEILEALVDVLRSSGDFRLVDLGASPQADAVPRCSVIYEGQELFQPDDAAATQWGRLRLSLVIHTRSEDVSQAVCRVDELCDQAAASILADPFQGGLCLDLPIGRATEVGRRQLARNLKRPEVEISLDVRCHFEVEEAA